MEIEINCVIPLNNGSTTRTLELIGRKDQVINKAIEWLNSLKDEK